MWSTSSNDFIKNRFPNSSNFDIDTKKIVQSIRQKMDSINFNKYINEVSVNKNWIFLDNAAVATITNCAKKAMQQIIDDYNLNAAVNSRIWDKTVGKTRELAARLLKCQPEEIAFVKNTSEGISFIANGIQFSRGDNVITTNVEFPANIYPWLNLQKKGVETRMVKDQNGRIPFEEIEKNVDEKTRVIAISSVEFSTGFRHNLERIGDFCKKKNIFFFVDGIQSIGVLDIDVKKCNIHALAADGHKWLLCPEGLGIFYLDKEKLNEVGVTEVGWTSVINHNEFLQYDFTFKPDARRFESGSLNMVGIYALNASLELLLEIGIGNIEKRVLELTDYLCENLKKKGYSIFSSRNEDEKSSIVSFYSSRHDSMQICNRLLQNRIIVACRDSRLRVSPHFYNTKKELDKLFEILQY